MVIKNAGPRHKWELGAGVGEEGRRVEERGDAEIEFENKQTD